MNLLILKQKLQVLSSLIIMGHPRGMGFMAKLCLSFSYGFPCLPVKRSTSMSFAQRQGIPPPVLRFFFRWNYSICRGRFPGSVEEVVNSSSSFSAFLNENHYANVFLPLIGSGWITCPSLSQSLWQCSEWPGLSCMFLPELENVG